MAPASALIPTCARRSRSCHQSRVQLALVPGDLDDELTDRERDDQPREENDGEDDHDRARQRERVSDAAPFEGAYHWPGDQSDEEPKQYRHDERRHLAEGERGDEDEGEPANREQRAGGAEQRVSARRIVRPYDRHEARTTAAFTAAWSAIAG